jgi:hypothetical protein
MISNYRDHDNNVQLTQQINIAHIFFYDHTNLAQYTTCLYTKCFLS